MIEQVEFLEMISLLEENYNKKLTDKILSYGEMNLNGAKKSGLK